jgi:hypothetical protein
MSDTPEVIGSRWNDANDPERGEGRRGRIYCRLDPLAFDPKATFLASFIFGLPPALVLLHQRSNKWHPALSETAPMLIGGYRK